MSEIQSLARGLQILDILEDALPDGIGITEIGDMLEIDKSSASRIMKTLANYGYAEQDAETRRYRLGSRVVQLGQSVLQSISLRDQAKPFLSQLVHQTGECAHIAILAQGHAFYLDQVESPASLKVSTGIGTLAPLHCTALGKVILAYSNATMPLELQTYTPRTITNPDALEMHLEQTRRQGYATDDEEYNYGVRCVAVPIGGLNGEFIGAMGISGPTGRMSLERLPELAEIVKEIGQALTDRLSFKVTTGRIE